MRRMASIFVFIILTGCSMKMDAGASDSHDRLTTSEVEERVPIENLNEYMWFADAAIVGTVMEEGTTYEHNIGVNTKIPTTQPVTPAAIVVDEVISGDIDQKVITLLQHGSSDDANDIKGHVKKGEKYVFILYETSTPNNYWTLDGKEGLWKIVDDKVTSDATMDVLQAFKSTDVKTFKSTLRRAIENKIKPKSIQ